MATLKEDQVILAVEDIDSEAGVINRRRYEQDEHSPLLAIGTGEENDFDGPFKPILLDSLPWYRRPAVYWLLAPFALSALAFGGVVVPKVNLVLSLICRDYLKDHSASGPRFIFSLDPGDECRIPEVQSRVSIFKLCMSGISGSLAAIVAPKLGTLSDRYGRTPMIVYINSGMIINEIITIFAAKFPDTISVYWILVGAIFDGLGGSFISSMAISHSYAADCTPSKKRNVVFGYFHGCLYTGIAVGPILAGYIIAVTGDVISMFYLACGCHFLFVLMLIFVIPESVPKARQLAARETHRQDMESRPAAGWVRKLRSFNILEPLRILHGPGSSPPVRRNLILLASTDTIVFGVGMGAAVVTLLYSNFIFGWDQWEQSIFTSVVNSCRVSYLLIILPIVTHWYRSRQEHDLSPASSSHDPHAPEGTDNFELAVIRFAILADSLGFLGYALAQTGTQFILAGAIASMGGIASPTMQAALTKHVPKESVGQLLGAMALLHAMGRVVGPVVFTGIYAATVAIYPQAYFIILTAMFGVGFVVSWYIRPGARLDSSNASSRLS